MVTASSIQRTARYASGVLALVFFVNLLLDSQVIPFVQQGPFFGNVAQFLTLLIASSLLALDFIIVDYLHDHSSEEDRGDDSTSETRAEPSVD
ncbi:hypothetical protein KTS45_13265 [Halomicroarcula limicola]|uniref:Uncharacterized protein n=1 Tax=Haloarcula limicola TaxID=1429915 RepID=A0A8J8C7M4_9EURY|nr:hypothetical protein [Halomicroarcula limicola]MBV0925168.1 hypothetical protein [Halomicroarcula limicola]